jgi:ubiquinone/menaquinone biosynthesis C-methylase UbiE
MMSNYSPSSVEAYYRDTTRNLLEHGAACGWHFALWDASTSSLEQALHRSSEILLQGCDLKPGCKVLDAGCGLGALAVHIAATFGAEVVGITLCGDHLKLAEQLACSRGVSELVRFERMDFNALEFEPDMFDLVVNQESFCYASDKTAYLAGVRRVLKSGGKWQAVDGFLSGTPLSAAQQVLHLQAQRGWKMPPLTTVQDVANTLAALQFGAVATADLSPMAMPTCRGYITKYIGQITQRANDEIAARDNIDAVLGASIGLFEGAMGYHFVSATKPRRIPCEEEETAAKAAIGAVHER